MISQYRRGMVASYAAFMVTALVNFILSPYLISKLGNELNGLYNTLVSFSVYFAMMDLGLGSTIIRYVAKYRDEGKTELVYKYLYKIRQIYLIIIAVTLTIGFVVAFFVPQIFSKSIPVGYEKKAILVFCMAVISIALTIFGNLYYSTLRAYEHFYIGSLTGILQDFLRITLIVSLLKINISIVGVAFAECFANLIVVLTRRHYTRTVLKVCFLKPEKNEIAIKEIFGFSLYVVVYSLINKIFWQLDKVLLGILAGGLAVTIYSLGSQLSAVVSSVSSRITSMYLPHAVKTTNHSTKEQYTLISAQMARYQLIIIVPVVIGFAFFGDSFIQLWVGQGYHESYYIALVLISAQIPVVLQSYGEAMLLAINKQRVFTIIMIVATILNICLTILAIPRWGAIGASVASVITNLLRCAVVSWYFKHVFGINPFQFIRIAFKCFVQEITIMCIFCTLLVKHFTTVNWFSLIFIIIIFAVFYILTAYFLMMNKKEKSIIQNYIGLCRGIIK